MHAISVEQPEVFKAAQMFARVEIILPAPNRRTPSAPPQNRNNSRGPALQKEQEFLKMKLSMERIDTHLCLSYETGALYRTWSKWRALGLWDEVLSHH